MYDIIILGTGPAGLFTAANIKNKKILILEKNSTPAKKLLISGSGQCNITHDGSMEDFITHYNNKNYAKKVLYRFTNEELISYFNNKGLKFILNKNGKYFPKSLKSQDILNILLNELGNNIKIKYNEFIEKITKKEDTFILKSKNKTYKAKNIIIATGGKSYPMLGTTGDGYKIAASFGHKIITPKPALAPFKIKDYYFSDLPGLSFNGAISIKKNKKKIKKYGDLLLTHVGISGPLILDFSRYVNDGDTITISFLNFKNSEEFLEELNKKIIQNSSKKIFSILKEFNLPERFIKKMFELLKIKNSLAQNISKDSKNKISNFLMNNEMIVEKLFDFNQAMVTSGGICTKEVNHKTLESKLVKGLFFAGEVLDIDGDTGGYNIQFAMSCGKIISENFSRK
ncbi:NAD(P)/FAD-dependent oxidoreductase [Tepiditoga spiralis]|nr:NAD(P)/FAD-dependent oxidoreductase [Tepiditoga spiralis]